MSSETQSYRFNHTMLRVKDPKASIEFYQNVLGMKKLHESPNPGAGFTLYFLGYEHHVHDNVFAREAVLELTHNYGTESNPEFQGYAIGNTNVKTTTDDIEKVMQQGFGHIAISVGDVEKACERFEKLGVRFQKTLKQGKMHNIAFILDPDGYWIEIVPGGLSL